MFIFLSTVSFAPILKEQNINNVNIFNIYNELKSKEIRQKQLNLFLNAIAYSESRHNPEALNSGGYVGLFAFGQAARNATGYGHIKTSDFIKDPSIWEEQEQILAMTILLQKNGIHLYDYIKDTPFIFSKRKIVVTKSGLLAAAHLSGSGNVIRYLETKGLYNPKDKNGTSLEDYLIRFAGYNF